MSNSELIPEEKNSRILTFDQLDLCENGAVSLTFYQQTCFVTDKIDSEEIELEQNCTNTPLIKKNRRESPFQFITVKSNRKLISKFAKNFQMKLKNVRSLAVQS